MLEKDFRIKIVDAFWGEATPGGFNEDGTPTGFGMMRIVRGKYDSHAKLTGDSDVTVEYYRTPFHPCELAETVRAAEPHMIRCAQTSVSTARIIRKELEEYGIDWHTGQIREDEDGTRIYSIAEAKKDIYQCQSVYAKDTFIEMIKDWQVDNAPLYDDLIISDAEFKYGEWTAIAEDEKRSYLLHEVEGNIIIDYLGTK